MKTIPRIVLYIVGLMVLGLAGDIFAIVTSTHVENSTWFNIAIIDGLVVMVGFLAIAGIRKSIGDALRRADEAVAVARGEQARSAAQAASLIEGFADPVAILDHHGKMLAANENAATVLGKPLAGLAGSSFVDYFSDRAATHSLLDRTRSQGSIRDATVLPQGADPNALGWALSASMMAPEGSDLPRILVHLRDDSEAIAKTEFANRQAIYLRNLIEASIDPLFAINAEGLVTDVNEAAVAKTGMPRKELVGIKFERLFTDPEASRRGHARVLVEGEIQGYPLVMKNVAGDPAKVSFNASLYRNEDGSSAGIFATARDVTATMLAEAERERKGWVAEGIARLNAVFQVQG